VEKNAPKGRCFPVRWDRIVAGMSETDWSDLDVTELLPTGTVTLLLADVEGSTQLWESQPSAMTPAVEQLNRTASKLIAEHGGIPPVEQGEGDSFVAAFARGQRCGGVRAGFAASTAGADQAADRPAHR